MGSEEIGPASASSVLSLDGTSHFERIGSSVLRTDPQMTPAKSQAKAESGEAACALESSVLPLDGTSKLERNDSSVSMTNLQMTLANESEREDNGEIGPVRSAKTAKTANSTHTFNMLSEHTGDEEM